MDKNTYLEDLSELYTSAKYDEGIKKLIDQKDQFDPDIYSYNLGAFFYKKGELGVARFHFEKSISEGFSSPAVYKNIKGIRSLLNVTKTESPRTVLDHYHYSLSIFPLEAFLSFTLILAIIALMRIKKSFKGPVVTLLIACIPLMAKIYFESNYSSAIVLRESAAKEGPSDVFPVSSSLPEGTKVIIKTAKDGWSSIVSPQHLAGWVSVNDLGVY